MKFLPVHFSCWYQPDQSATIDLSVKVTGGVLGVSSGDRDAERCQQDCYWLVRSLAVCQEPVICTSSALISLWPLNHLIDAPQWWTTSPSP